MSQPATFPPELHDEIVDLLEDCHEALRQISATSKAFVPRARPILFRHIRILSFKRILQLAELLNSKLCTIPTTAESLEIQFEYPVRGRKQDYSSDDVCFALADVYDHFQIFEVSISLNFPWPIGRRLDWTYCERYTSIRKFSITGTYSWIHDVTDILYYLPNLESFIVDASFKHDGDASLTVGIPSGIRVPCRVSSTLKELALSPESLPMMRWFCGLGSERPSTLHTFRIKVDNISLHRPYFHDVIPFLKEYGKELAHLYVWFDASMVDYEDLYEALGDALQHTTNLEHLEVLFAGSWDDGETEAYMKLILPFYMRRPAIVRVRAGECIGLDEAEFWETPLTMCEIGEDRVVCERLVKLS